MSEKTRYSDEELQEFKQLILEKLAKAQRDYELLKAAIFQVLQCAFHIFHVFL